jgi:hypothetical protein
MPSTTAGDLSDLLTPINAIKVKVEDCTSTDDELRAPINVDHIGTIADNDWPTMQEITCTNHHLIHSVQSMPTKLEKLPVLTQLEKLLNKRDGLLKKKREEWLAACEAQKDKGMVAVLQHNEAVCRKCAAAVFQYEVLLLLQLALLQAYIYTVSPPETGAVSPPETGTSTRRLVLESTSDPTTDTFFGFTNFHVIHEKSSHFWKEVVCWFDSDSDQDGNGLKNNLTRCGFMPTVQRQWVNVWLGMAPVVYR